jgi:ferritin-like metal-binding protein YciE
MGAGKSEVVRLMQETLEEEKKADKLLNDLAAKEINKQALKHVA